MKKRRYAYSVLVGKPERKSHLENPDVDGRILLRFRKWVWDLDCIDLAQNTDRWRPFVNTVMNLWVP
jgi:hypothetical protein